MKSQCEQALQCGHPDDTTLAIFLSLLILHILYLLWLLYIFQGICFNSKLRQTRAVVQVTSIFLYIIISVVYYAGVFIEFGDTFYYIIQNLPGIFYETALLVYLSNWINLIFNMSHRDPSISKKQIHCANSLLTGYAFVLYLLYAILVTMGGFQDDLRMQELLLRARAIMDFWIGASSVMSIGYLSIMISMLRVLRRNYSALYYKMRGVVLLATATQFIGLALKVLYILLSVQLNVTEEESKYLEIPQRVLFSLIPLTISSVVTVSVVEVNSTISIESLQDSSSQLEGIYEQVEEECDEVKQQRGSAGPSVSTHEKTIPDKQEK